MKSVLIFGVSGMLASGGTALRMNGHEFSLYYNNAPSKLGKKKIYL